MTESKVNASDGGLDATTLPSHEDIERVAYCVGVYLSAFSKEPFDEQWSVDGLKVPGFLLNPRTTAHFVKELFSQESLALSAAPAGGEQAVVSKGLLLKHLEETLSDPMTGFLCDTEWFSETDMKGLREHREVLTKSKKELFNLHMPYPLTNIVRSYVEAIQSDYSLLSLGYHGEWEYDPMLLENIQDKTMPQVKSEFKLLRITPETVIPDNIYPRFTGRYLTLNHPGDKVRENAIELAITETIYYLNNDEQDILRNNIEPDLYTTFFAEISKIPDKDKSISGFLQSGIKYIEIVSRPSSNIVGWELKDLLPKQLLYMSLPGTAVASKSKSSPTDSKLLQAIRVFYEPYGLEYKEEVLTFPKPDGQTVIFGIIKQV